MEISFSGQIQCIRPGCMGTCRHLTIAPHYVKPFPQTFNSDLFCEIARETPSISSQPAHFPAAALHNNSLNRHTRIQQRSNRSNIEACANSKHGNRQRQLFPLSDELKQKSTALLSSNQWPPRSIIEVGPEGQTSEPGSCRASSTASASSNGAATSPPHPSAHPAEATRGLAASCLVASTQVDTVGVLGGMGPLATVDFVRRVIEATPARSEADHLPIIVCNDPRIPDWRLPILRSANGTASRSGSTPARESGGEADLLTPVEALLKKRRFLEQAGARCVVMPCHAAHYWFDELAAGCPVPFLHVADALVEELKAKNLQPLEAGGRPKVGLLGAEATLRAGFYQERLKAAGFEVVLPDKATMEHAVIPGVDALQRRDMEGARNLLRIAAQVLLVNAVNTVVLACPDMSTVFAPDDPTLQRCLDPMDCLARYTVKWAQGARHNAAQAEAEAAGGGEMVSEPEHQR